MEAALFFQLPLDPAILKNPTYRIRDLPFFRSGEGPFLYQAVAAVWLFKNGASVKGGAFLGDEMGLGKTIVYLTLVILRAIYLEQRSHQSSNEAAHLRADDRRTECPSRTLWGTPCICERGSLFNRMDHDIIMEGLAVIMCPLKSIVSVKDTIRAFIDTETIKLRVEHTYAAIDRLPLAQRSGNRVSTKCELSETEAAEIMGCDWEWESPTAVKLSKYILVTTYESYESRVEKKVGANAIAVVIVDECHRQKIVKYDALTDRWQLPGALRHCKRARTKGGAFIIAVSGTLIQNGPFDVLGYIHAFQQVPESWPNSYGNSENTWLSIPNLRKFVDTELYQHAKNYANYSRILAHIADDADDRAVEQRQEAKVESTKISRLLNELCKEVLIQRDSESKWFGTPMLPLPDSVKEARRCEWVKDAHIEAAFDHALENARKELRVLMEGEENSNRTRQGASNTAYAQSKLMSCVRRLRTALSFPYLAVLCLEHELKLTVNECKEMSWIGPKMEDPSSLLVKNLDKLIRSRPKVREIEQILNMRKQNSSGRLARHENGTAVDKVVIMSFSTVNCVIIYLVTISHFPHFLANSGVAFFSC